MHRRPIRTIEPGVRGLDWEKSESYALFCEASG